MRGMVVAGLAAVAAMVPAAQGQDGRAQLHGAWLQTAPVWSITPDNPWTVMIFNPDGSFCGGSKKDNRYNVGTYTFDGVTMTTTSASTGRVTSRTVEFSGQRAVMHDPQIDEPVVVVRTDMFANCAALKAHQGQ